MILSPITRKKKKLLSIILFARAFLNILLLKISCMGPLFDERFRSENDNELVFNRGPRLTIATDSTVGGGGWVIRRKREDDSNTNPRECLI